MSLGTLVVELTANVAKFQSDLGRAEQVAQNTAKRIDEQFGVVKNALANFGLGLASAYTFDAISKKIEGVISSAAGLQQLSERTGATVESLSGLSSVAKLSGTDSEALATGLQKLSRTMVDAQQGGTKTRAQGRVQRLVFGKTLRVAQRVKPELKNVLCLHGWTPERRLHSQTPNWA